MRLNKKQKDEILSDALDDILTERFTEIKKVATRLADDVYNFEYGEESDKIDALKLKHNWSPSYSSTASFVLDKETVYMAVDKRPLYQSNSERDAMGEIEFEFASHYAGHCVSLSQARRFPPHGSDELHVTAKKHKHRLELLREDCKALVAEEKKLRAELERFLAACKTRQQLIDNWPEGEKYVPVVEKKNLPIPLIDNVRKAQRAKV